MFQAYSRLFLVTAAMVATLFLTSAAKVAQAAGSIAKSAELTQPLQAGDAAPGFTVQTVDGAPFEFDPQSLRRPVVLITFRGGWCPYCNMHLSELKDVVPQIADLGVDVLFVSGDRADVLYSSLKRETQDAIAGLDYQIFSDADANMAIAYGVAFEEAPGSIERRVARGDDIEGSSMLRHGVLPVPAVFAIDSSGTIVFAHVNPDYKVRLPANELLEVATNLAAGK